MKVTLFEPQASQRPLLDALAQLNAYDFSEMVELDVTANGSFPAHPCFTQVWGDPNRHARIIKADDQIAGFAIIHWIADEDLWDMEQFFVLRRHRRSGVGRAAALQVFATFPGNWEVAQIQENPTAHAFWGKVISDFTSGNFSERAGEFPTQCFTA